MNPRSGRRGAWRAASSFFAIIASDAESVRDFTIVSPRLSNPRTESPQPRAVVPTFVTHPERRSLDAPFCVARETHSLGSFPFFATHTTGSRASASGRRETEYINAARDETATASSSIATSSSPITKPRRLRVPERCSPGTSTAPSCRPMYYAESPGRPRSCSLSQLRTS
jgi:hypothetical protein